MKLTKQTKMILKVLNTEAETLKVKMNSCMTKNLEEMYRHQWSNTLGNIGIICKELGFAVMRNTKDYSRLSERTDYIFVDVVSTWHIVQDMVAFDKWEVK